mgnify:CR=1 FL=1
MTLYRVVWVTRLYGKSMVEANSKQEAFEKAMRGEDTEFEELDPNSGWEIDPETDSIQVC